MAQTTITPSTISSNLLPASTPPAAASLPTYSSGLPPPPTQISSWISWCLSFPWALLKLALGLLPSPAHQDVTAPTSSLCSSQDYAWSTVSWAFHFLLVLTSLPAQETFMSLESLYSSNFLARVTINSSSRLLKGSFSLFLLLYKAMLLGNS